MYGIVLIIIIVAAVSGGRTDNDFLPFMVVVMGSFIGLHIAAAIGAKNGRNYGRTISRLVGVLMLFGFPLGTFIGILLLVNTGDAKWETEEESIWSRREAPK